MKRKTGYASLVLALFLIVFLLAGCGKQPQRNTFREDGILLLNQGEYKKAVDSFDHALDASKGLVNKFDLDVLKYRAEAEYLSKDYKAAVASYDVLIQVDGDKPEYFNMRSASKAETGDIKGSIKDYKRGIELDKASPQRLPALLATGTALEQAGSFSEAMELYQAAEADGVTSALLYNRMGLCQMAKKDWESAASFFQKGIQAPEGDKVTELLFNQAVCEEYKGNFKAALLLMNQYVNAHGTDEEAEREIKFLKTR
ncbi:tetratricopeptide repeat protein [Clostridium sp. E02]|uniref:tetratricopeptide repeat protein n=1 Tax=Clostridium sp. E02 TaxID=2487134 RepID=UPI000F51D537|nr:tetratricopeptide repeat protein [Clostridium sp. E02]